MNYFHETKSGVFLGSVYQLSYSKWETWFDNVQDNKYDIFTKNKRYSINWKTWLKAPCYLRHVINEMLL